MDKYSRYRAFDQQTLVICRVTTCLVALPYGDPRWEDGDIGQSVGGGGVTVAGTLL